MMGRLKSDQGQLFYEFHLSDAVPEDHLVRKIDAALDLSWLRSALAPHYSSIGRPSIDPELMIRMLVVGYVFAIRSERLICREVQVNLAYRWFCKLGIEDAVPDHSAFSRARNDGVTTLFAALDVLEGKVIGQCMKRHRRQEFIRFLNVIEAVMPWSGDCVAMIKLLPFGFRFEF